MRMLFVFLLIVIMNKLCQFTARPQMLLPDMVIISELRLVCLLACIQNQHQLLQLMLVTHGRGDECTVHYVVLLRVTFAV
ncbi:hypothetical protein BX666DRAFT_1882931 [Dichotomocladium elegans]|nr:hypothetical protein BX666DRAFT_1882931 [Dichotomocladium elegans]